MVMTHVPRFQSLLDNEVLKYNDDTIFEGKRKKEGGDEETRVEQCQENTLSDEQKKNSRQHYMCRVKRASGARLSVSSRRRQQGKVLNIVQGRLTLSRRLGLYHLFRLSRHTKCGKYVESK